MSAESKGYVVGNAGTGETAAKNLAAFKNWSIASAPVHATFRLIKVNMCSFEMQCPRFPNAS